jgi:ankyrin repeat protein
VLPRTLTVLLLVALIVPATAWTALTASRELHLGLRMQSAEFKVKYLLGAAENRATDEVKRLVRWGVVPATAADASGYTALMGAALGGDPEMIEYLIDRGARVNAAVEKTTDPLKPAGTTALMNAAMHGHAKAVRVLLDRGADPNPGIPWGEFAGMSALFIAVQQGHLEVVEQLLQRGTQVGLHHHVSHHGIAFYPLTLALRDERLDIAEKLVAAGSSVDWLVPVGRAKGYSQLMLLVSFDGPPRLKAVEWTAKRSNAIDYVARESDCRRCTAMSIAQSRKQRDVVRILAEAGAQRWHD